MVDVATREVTGWIPLPAVGMGDGNVSDIFGTNTQPGQASSQTGLPSKSRWKLVVWRPVVDCQVDND